MGATVLLIGDGTIDKEEEDLCRASGIEEAKDLLSDKIRYVICDNVPLEKINPLLLSLVERIQNQSIPFIVYGIIADDVHQYLHLKMGPKFVHLMH